MTQKGFKRKASQSHVLQFALFALLASITAITAFGCVSLADFATPEALQVIDAHNHLNRDMPAEELVKLMDRNGVRAMVLMARYYGGKGAGYGRDEQAADYAAKYPGRFIPFVAGQRGMLLQRVVWEFPTKVGDIYLQEAEKKLKSGGYFGLGEFILYHHAYDLSLWGQLGGEVRLPVDSYLMRRIAKLGAKYDVPVLFHAEAEPNVVPQVEAVLKANPRTSFIWAHNCGRGKASQTSSLLERYPNLMCDLGGMAVIPNRGGYGRYWPRRTEWIHLVQKDGGALYEEMKALFENFPDRFMIGIDTAHTPAMRFYDEWIHAFRQLLSQLTPLTARKIARKNAERVFAGALSAHP
jgi:predicted TIM-barrel fold metal-dependent hydrolase